MTKVEEKGRLKYSKFDKMDTDVLEAILRADFDAQEAERMEVETVIYISNLLAERREPPKKDTRSAKAEFFEYYYPLAGDEKSIYDFEEEEDREKEKQVGEPERKQKTEAGIWLRSWRRFASAVAILVLVVFGSGATAYALGFNPFPVRAVWDDEQFWFESELPTYEILQVVEKYENIDNLIPRWLPGGYEFDKIEVAEQSNGIDISASYYNETRGSLVIGCFNLNGYKNSLYEKDAAEVIVYTSHEVEYYMMSNNSSLTAAWNSGNTEYFFTGRISIEEAEKMIDSIYDND